MRSTPSAVKRLALARGLTVAQPERLGAAEADVWRAARPEAVVVAAYGALLPAPFLDLAPRGALNIHASLLPRWRGAAPIQRALLAGDRETGISIMRMDAGLDTGPVISRHPLAITDDDDAGSLHDKLAALGGDAIVAALDGDLQATPQPKEGATYARKIAREDAVLDWTRSAGELERVVRAMRPAPGATTTLDGEGIKIRRARLTSGSGAVGTVIDAEETIVVACGAGALAITELQRAGGKLLAAAEFLRGRPLARGARLG
jgi:methionyl-tRNA formyltransferase